MKQQPYKQYVSTRTVPGKGKKDLNSKFIANFQCQPDRCRDFGSISRLEAKFLDQTITTDVGNDQFYVV